VKNYPGKHQYSVSLKKNEAAGLSFSLIETRKENPATKHFTELKARVLKQRSALGQQMRQSASHSLQ
jgi:hypothetical protein